MTFWLAFAVAGAGWVGVTHRQRALRGDEYGLGRSAPPSYPWRDGETGRKWRPHQNFQNVLRRKRHDSDAVAGREAGLRLNDSTDAGLDTPVTPKEPKHLPLPPSIDRLVCAARSLFFP